MSKDMEAGFKEPFIWQWPPVDAAELKAKLNLGSDEHLFDHFMELHSLLVETQHQNLVMRGQLQAFQMCVGMMTGTKTPRHGRRNHGK